MINDSASPDVVFAQKATAIVKAAGMDPKAMDLESFRKWAPLIFTNAYCAIYKEQLISDLGEYSSKEEQILNSQLVIDGLIAKTRNPILSSISGIDIFQGNHKAIGMLVGVLFAEGQRMWLEKNKAAQAKAPQPASKPANTLTEDKGPETSAPSSPTTDNGELDKLVSRINYLEMRLRRKGPKRPKSSVVRNQPTPDSKAKQRPQSASAVVRPLAANGDAASDLSESDHEQGRNSPESSPVRPTSTATTPSKSHKVKSVSDRLYSAPLNRRAMENLIAAAQPPPVPKEKPAFDPSLYTYDLKSGRRILLTQAEYEREERRRKKEAMGNVMAVAALDDVEQKKDVSALPTRPDYPCKRIEKSVDEWLQKMRRDRFENRTHSRPKSAQQSASSQYDKAQRSFSVYDNMENLDIILSVEHCHDCENHKVSLRHNPGEYIRQANNMLTYVAQEILGCGACVRLGVARIEAEFDHSGDEEHSRYGAFEVQIACRGLNGEKKVEVLHSKLLSRHWPSKSVMAKRLKAFLSKNKVPIAFNQTVEFGGDADYETATAHGHSYPVGRCGWSETELSQTRWAFPPNIPVQYVFDSRVLHDAPSFSIGATVWVKAVQFSTYCTELHPLIGVVKKYQESSGKDKSLYVKLKYTNEEILVKEKSCVKIQEFQFPHLGHSDCDREWCCLELEGAVLLAHAEKLLHFKALLPEDKINSKQQLELSRSSFFTQLRSIVWEVVKHFRTKHLHSFTHPVLAKAFDIHLAYSEPALDGVFENFGSLINTHELMAAVGLVKERSLKVSFSDAHVEIVHAIDEAMHEAIIFAHDSEADAEKSKVSESENSESPRPALESEVVDERVLLDPSSPRAHYSNAQLRDSPDDLPPVVPLVSQKSEGDLSIPDFDVLEKEDKEENHQKFHPAPDREEQAKIDGVIVDKQGDEAGDDYYNQSSFIEESTEKPPSAPVQQENESNEEMDQVKELMAQDKDIVFSSLVIEGPALEHAAYDTVFLSVQIEGKEFEAIQCLPRERGSQRRTFNVNWGDIFIRSEQFKLGHVMVTVAVKDVGVAVQYPDIPLVSVVEEDITRANRAVISLRSMMDSSFEVKDGVEIWAEAGVERKVMLSFQGHAREAKSTRTTRIMSMKPTDLINLKFDPIPAVEDFEDSQDSPAQPVLKVLPTTPSVQDLEKGLFPNVSTTELNPSQIEAQ